MILTTLIKGPYAILRDGASLLRARYSFAQKRSIFIGYAKLHVITLAKRSNAPTTIALCGMRVSGFGADSLLFLFREIFIKGEYNFETSNPVPSILDCGANIGMATLFFKWKFPASIIDAFEPDPTTFEILRKNVEQNGLKGITLHNAALGKEQGSATLYTNSKDPGSLIMSVNRKRRDGAGIEIRAEKLSSYAARAIDFLKLDVEGSEHAVLEDMDSSGALANIREMMLEYHHKIGGENSRMSSILSVIEKTGFEYQLECANIIPAQKHVYQDVLIYCYRK